MIFNFGDKNIINNFKTIYADFHNSANKFQNEMNAVVVESKNERCVNIVKNIYDTYNEFLSGRFYKEIINEWKNSPSSFANKAKSTGAKEAISTAKKMQGEVENIADTSNIFKLSEIPDISQPEISVENYDKMINCCENYVQNLQNDYDKAKKNIHKLEQSNNLASSILGVCSVTYEMAINYWKNQTKSLKIEKSEFEKTSKKNINQISQNDATNKRNISNAATSNISMPQINKPTMQYTAGSGGSSATNDTAGSDSGSAANDTTESEIPDDIMVKLEEIENSFNRNSSEIDTLRKLADCLVYSANQFVESFEEPIYCKVVLGLAKICESYFTYVGDGFLKNDSWEEAVKREFVHCFLNKNFKYFVEGDQNLFDQDRPETYITVARMLQNQCECMLNGYTPVMSEDIEDVANKFRDMLVEETSMNKDKEDDFEWFSREAAKMTECIMNGIPFSTVDCSKYEKINDENIKYKEFVSCSKKFYEKVAETFDKRILRLVDIGRVADIYADFFGNYSPYIRIKDISTDKLRTEMVQVSFDHRNNEYFNPTEWDLFCNISPQTLQYGEYSAKMLKNVGQSGSYENIIYGLYVNHFLVENVRVIRYDENIEDFLNDACATMYSMISKLGKSYTYEEFISYSKEFYEKVVQNFNKVILNTDLINKAADIYADFFGNYLPYIRIKDISTDKLRTEMVQVSFDHRNNEYFNPTEWDLFCNISPQTLQYGEYSAKMLKNVGQSGSYENIIYALYVNHFLVENVQVVRYDKNIENFLNDACVTMQRMILILASFDEDIALF